MPPKKTNDKSRSIKSFFEVNSKQNSDNSISISSSIRDWEPEHDDSFDIFLPNTLTQKAKSVSTNKLVKRTTQKTKTVSINKPVKRKTPTDKTSSSESLDLFEEEVQFKTKGPYKKLCSKPFLLRRTDEERREIISQKVAEVLKLPEPKIDFSLCDIIQENSSDIGQKPLLWLLAQANMDEMTERDFVTGPFAKYRNETVNPNVPMATEEVSSVQDSRDDIDELDEIVNEGCLPSQSYFVTDGKVFKKSLWTNSEPTLVYESPSKKKREEESYDNKHRDDEIQDSLPDDEKDTLSPGSQAQLEDDLTERGTITPDGLKFSVDSECDTLPPDDFQLLAQDELDASKSDEQAQMQVSLSSERDFISPHDEPNAQNNPTENHAHAPLLDQAQSSCFNRQNERMSLIHQSTRESPKNQKPVCSYVNRNWEMDIWRQFTLDMTVLVDVKECFIGEAYFSDDSSTCTLHSNILSCRCPALFVELLDSIGRQLHFPCSSAFKAFLDYLYTGSLQRFYDLSEDNKSAVYDLSQKYGVTLLSGIIEASRDETQSSPKLNSVTLDSFVEREFCQSFNAKPEVRNASRNTIEGGFSPLVHTISSDSSSPVAELLPESPPVYDHLIDCITPKGQHVISTIATPRPAYSTMPLERLQKELSECGLKKDLAPDKAVKILNYIFDQIHPSKDHPNVRKALEDVAHHQNDSSGPKRALDPTELLETENAGSRLTPEKKVLMRTVSKFIKSNTELYCRILKYEPIWLHIFQGFLKENHIKCNSRDLSDVLDELGVFYRVGRSRKPRRTR